ncbi:succinate dehydrogenase iron-sulfur subunit [Rubrivirga sp. S365]|uniref:succinate dehydrogenase n=2 Tax=Rubricoccaceae TaxID=1853227 RepID=A0ABU3BQ19_9BACT|nr:MULTISPECIES: succinate dehydrogenase iron-sulfur subunit [unclassified Rubrivirga]MDT0631296.1 succinate dehydrogenase iron-sulfur subunit [Rubrivirga sp. F394]MDT7856000.1 succinate dehydrogenase iron-sulfur subunit [Rubrivirga sp. S365]
MTDDPTPVTEPIEDRVEEAEKSPSNTPRRRAGGAAPTMTLTVKVKRFNPETDERPHFDAFQVPAEAMDRALDLLHYVKWHLDGTLTFRKSCAHGICGSDAMKINGENQLACSILVQDLGLKDGDTVTFEPLPAAPVIKDLVVDQSRFFDKYRAVMPWLINDEATPVKERIQSPEQHAVIEDATKCIMCGACTHSCPSTWADPDYLGPAAMLKAYRYVFDSRDTEPEERLKVVDSKDGLWKCYTIFNCVQACPKGIDITRWLSALKRKSVTTRY